MIAYLACERSLGIGTTDALPTSMNANAKATRTYEDLRRTGGTAEQWIACATALETAASEAPQGCNAGEALLDRAESARMNARRAK